MDHTQNNKLHLIHNFQKYRIGRVINRKGIIRIKDIGDTHNNKLNSENSLIL